jgi:hypothetical protein
MNLLQIEKWSLLAGFRFLLALVVAAGHLGRFTSLKGLQLIAWLNPFHAILGFLLVSGYSVGSSYLQAPRGFLWRRILRIYPIYAASMVLACAVWVLVAHQKPPDWKTIILNLALLNQAATNYSIIGPAWSLSLEFWLYCLVPFFFRRSPGVLRIMCYGSFLLLTVYTLGRSAFHWPYFSNTTLGLNLPLLSFVWICGLRLTDPRSSPDEVFLDLRFFFIAQITLETMTETISRLRHHDPCGVVTTVLPHEALHALPLTACYILFRHCVVGAAGGGSRSTTLRLLGDIAYPLYLVHIPVFGILHERGVTNPYLLLTGAVAAAALFYAVLDRYSQRRHLRQAVGN